MRIEPDIRQENILRFAARSIAPFSQIGIVLESVGMFLSRK